MEAQQVVVMRVEANLEDEKVRNEEYRAIVKKYEERHSEMEVCVQRSTLLIESLKLEYLKTLSLLLQLVINLSSIYKSI